MHFGWVICSRPPLFLGKWHALPFIISLLLLTRLFPQRACGMWQSVENTGMGKQRRRAVLLHLIYVYTGPI